MKKVAVTGGLSSGKSTVVRLFQEFGAYVVSADEIVHQLLIPHSPQGQTLVDWMGREILNPDGSLNRKKIGERVFSSPEALGRLESLLHPEVFQAINFAFEKAQKEKASLFVAEVPLLFETGKESLFDATIFVQCPLETACERFVSKTKLSSKDFYLRQKRMISPEKLKAKANFVIVNDESLKKLKENVFTIFKHLQE